MPVHSSVAAQPNRAKLVMATKGQPRHTIKYAATLCKVPVAEVWKLIPSAGLFSWDAEAKQYYILTSDIPALKEKLATRAPGPVVSMLQVPAADKDLRVTRNQIAERLRAMGYKADFQKLSKIFTEGKWPKDFPSVGKRKESNAAHASAVYNPGVVDALKEIFEQRRLNYYGLNHKINSGSKKGKVTGKVQHHTGDSYGRDALEEGNLLLPPANVPSQPQVIVTKDRAAYVSLNDLAADLIVAGFEKAGVYLLTKHKPKV